MKKPLTFRICTAAARSQERSHWKDEWRVGRVIARPYVGKKKGEFKRTSNRHDYALKPTGLTALNALKDKGLDVIGVGKINDIFCGRRNHRDLSFRQLRTRHGADHPDLQRGFQGTLLCEPG